MTNTQIFVLLILFLYIPFHISEEAAGNFPDWMWKHKWTPDPLTYGHWLASNLFFFYPLLLAAFLLYLFCGIRFLGGGILIWGIINCLEHLAYTVRNRKKSPGLFTGFLFAVDSAAGILNFSRQSGFNAGFLAASAVTGIVLFSVPILLNMVFHDPLKRHFEQ